jgi:aspartate carbamoyltransferase catalytic subunit
MLKHLLSMEDLSRDDIVRILDSADAFFEVSRRPVRKVPTLKGKTIINLFFEASTRTRTSFEIAGKRLSADVINISSSGSSVSKGESLMDTVKTLNAMHCDVLVVRHSASGAAEFVAKHTSGSVVNAGDGMHEHPTQALLDAFTIRRHKGKLDGLVVTIAGDIAHSRVARSNALLLAKFGVEVRFCAPDTLLPKSVDTFGARLYSNLDAAVEGADVVMMLRIQRERLQSALIPSVREYSKTFGLHTRTLSRTKNDVLVMHPGPMNRGVEIDDDVADGAHSAILDQVEAGVATRMAVLYLLAGDS